MVKQIAICFVVLSSFISCKKEDTTLPYGILNLRIEGQEDNIMWETITSKWIYSSGQANMEASSYYFDHCSINLVNITGTGIISPITLSSFYYTDGLDFQPNAVSGTIIITQADDKAIKGIFDVRFENNYGGVIEKKVRGDFGIINNQ